MLYGSRCIQLPLIEKPPQWLSGPSPSLSVATDRPTVTRPDSNDVRTRSIYSTISTDDINAQSGWSLKTERIRWKWHVYLDTTHTIRHSILAWTSLYPFAFLKIQLKHMWHFRLLFFNFWLALLSELYSGTYLPGSNINRNKLNQNMGHTSAFTQSPLPSCLHTNICMQTWW
jgi:hypothetical protein